MKLSICVIWVDRKKYFWLWCNHSQLLVKDNIKSKKMTFLSLGGYLLSLFCFNGLSDILDNWIDQHLLDCLPVNYVDGCRWQHVKPLAARLRVLLHIKAAIIAFKGFWICFYLFFRKTCSIHKIHPTCEIKRSSSECPLKICGNNLLTNFVTK